jgi:hypothetical protein
MPRRVLELLLQRIQRKKPEDYLFTRANGKPVKDFRGSRERVRKESGLPDCVSMISVEPLFGSCAAGMSHRRSLWKWEVGPPPFFTGTLLALAEWRGNGTRRD